MWILFLIVYYLKILFVPDTDRRGNFGKIQNLIFPEE